MRVLEVYNPNQVRAECPTCRQDTVYQRVTSKDLDYFYCSLDFQRTHTVQAWEILPIPEPKPKAVLPPPHTPILLSPEPVVETRLGFKERTVISELSGWTVPGQNRRAVCRTCGRYSHYKPGLWCSEFRHQIAYQRALAAKRKGFSDIPLHTVSTRKTTVTPTIVPGVSVREA